MKDDTLLFNYARRKKRQWGREPMAGLTAAEFDELKAVIREYEAQSAPTARQDAPPATKPAPRPPTALANAAAFYDAVRATLGPLDQSEVDGTDALLKAMGGANWPLSWAAYGLATARHETAGTMQPIKEYGGNSYFTKMYDIRGERPNKARELGNMTPGDGAKYAGRGYVQLTGKTNYANAGAAVGTDLVGNPDFAMEPGIAAEVMIWGMTGGKFTGKGLGDYLPTDKPADPLQLTQARRVINGQDKAVEIAAIASKYQAALEKGGWA